MGDTSELDAWVLAQVVQFYDAWRKRGYGPEPAVGVSLLTDVLDIHGSDFRAKMVGDYWAGRRYSYTAVAGACRRLVKAGKLESSTGISSQTGKQERQFNPTRSNPTHVLRGFKGLMPTTEPAKITGLIGKKKEFMCRVVGFDLCRVDGVHIRAQWADFVGGGHRLVYRFIPANEIWIDTSVREWPGYLASHEIIEVLLMKMLHWKYERAHEAANALEQDLRGIRERTSPNEALICEAWDYHLKRHFTNGLDVHSVAQTIARQLWKYL